MTDVKRRRYGENDLFGVDDWIFDAWPGFSGFFRRPAG
jgi:hypothetical protein